MSCYRLSVSMEKQRNYGIVYTVYCTMYIQDENNKYKIKRKK